MKKLTPVLIVDRVEDVLPFWVDRFGFEKTVEVPHGDAIGFAILVAGDVELMIQSRASVKDDLPALAAHHYRTALYVEVADLADVRSRAKGLPVLVPERTTFYGSREIGFADPAGNSVVFAQPGAKG